MGGFTTKNGGVFKRSANNSALGAFAMGGENKLSLLLAALPIINTSMYTSVYYDQTTRFHQARQPQRAADVMPRPPPFCSLFFFHPIDFLRPSFLSPSY